MNLEQLRKKEAEDFSMDTISLLLLLLLATIGKNSLLCLPVEGIASFNKLYEQSYMCFDWIGLCLHNYCKLSLKNLVSSC